MATFLVVLKSTSALQLVKREEKFFRGYEIELDIVSCSMAPRAGTAAILAGGGVLKDFRSPSPPTSVGGQRGNGQASLQVAAIQITTDNTVFGGLGGAVVHAECISWGKEAAEGRNVMVFTDLILELLLLCQGLAEAYGSGPRAAGAGRVLTDEPMSSLSEPPPTSTKVRT
jgi:deoxyhypusine synthase